MCIFFFNDTATTEIYTLSLHDALPISLPGLAATWEQAPGDRWAFTLRDNARFWDGAPVTARDVLASWRSHDARSEEHTSELQSPCNLVCRLLLEKKKINT